MPKIGLQLYRTSGDVVDQRGSVSILDPFDSGGRADDQRVAQVEKQARLEHAGDALELSIERPGVVDGGKPAVDDLVAAVGQVRRAIGQVADRRGGAELSAACARCVSHRSD